MERATGLEPATSSLGSLHSTTELCPPEGAAATNLDHSRHRGQGKSGRACLSLRCRYTEKVKAPSTDTASALYFFPDQDITEAELRSILVGHDQKRRAWGVSHLLRYAQWDDIWTYVSREEVREMFAELDLPENLRVAWGRMLKVEAPVS